MKSISRHFSSFFPLLICLGTALLLSACSKLGETTSDADTDGKPVVALVMKSLANEFFKTMEDGAKAHQTENAESYSLITNGIKNETDLAQQVALVEQMVSRGVDAIVIAPADSKALVPALKKAQDAGIIVINIDNKLDRAVLVETGAIIPFVGPDNREGAKAVGEALAATLEAGAKVAILEGVPTAFNAQQRRAGFEDAMKAAEAEIVSVQSAQWEMEKANTVSSGILTSHPDLAAILASNDSMALGAAAAVKASGKQDEVKIVGFDNISAVQAIRSGEGQPEDKTTPVDLVTKESL